MLGVGQHLHFAENLLTMSAFGEAADQNRIHVPLLAYRVKMALSSLGNREECAWIEPLPYMNPSCLMSVNESSIESPLWPLSYPDFLDWRLNNSFSSLDIYHGAWLSSAVRRRH
jgi:hypothetical protein